MAPCGVFFFEDPFMIYGIDVAKTTHYAAVMNLEGVVLAELFAFTNDAPGFASLLNKVSSHPKSDLVFSLESTGFYSENLICFLYESGYRLAVINPIQTATLRKTNIRKTKTDKARLKIQLAGFVNILFTDLAFLFKYGTHIKARYTLLKRYSSPSEICLTLIYSKQSPVESVSWSL